MGWWFGIGWGVRLTRKHKALWRVDTGRTQSVRRAEQWLGGNTRRYDATGTEPRESCRVLGVVQRHVDREVVALLSNAVCAAVLCLGSDMLRAPEGGSSSWARHSVSKECIIPE